MTSEKPSASKPVAGSAKEAASGKERPDWANGLRRLYDSVVEEELPDSFKDLLSQLDSKD
ncbi:hypothetical protein K3152_08450 [Qipengyuania sp. 1NDH17]|uniref:Anti-sigma factor NepR domain-containing protein n=1 Tax=Qipengyuania polymorpha TaxID=2867234 RepID=A0ABS7J4B3_9SPHN|nr:NepR family anti-sigma factor [Qipengyuania polymorpha]MBX7458273.1 hypothetical protein [Qipengyuania polymorpha]